MNEIKNPILLEIDPEKLGQTLSRVIFSGGLTIPHPLARMMERVINESEAMITDRVGGILRELINSNEFESRLVSVYREAMLGEAQRLARGAARAIIHAEPKS